MNKTIIVDVDGVILDYHQGIIEAYQEHYIECDNPVDLLDVFSPTVGNGFIALFNQTTKFSKLEPYRESDVYLKKLYDEGFTINLISACGDSLNTQQLRLDNIKAVFGDIFDEITMVGLGKSKVEYLKSFTETNFVYIDDSYDHYLDAESLGLDAIMMATDFNSHLDTNKVYNWRELYEYIVKKY